MKTVTRILAALPIGLVPFMLLVGPRNPPAALAGTGEGCSVTFRHGGIVQADECQDMGESVAYRRFEGWVVVLKSALMSMRDATGTARFNPAWTPEEGRARLRDLPQEGGVPVGPVGLAAAPPAAPTPQQPLVVYVPVPMPEPAPPVYEVAAPYIGYPAGFVICRRCVSKPPVPSGLPTAQLTPTNPFNIGPMAIQRTFPSISPFR